MRMTLILASVAVAASALTWWLSAVLYKPSEHDFLVTTTSYYFKRMSEKGTLEVASFRDCTVEPGEDSDRRQGVSMFGMCKAEGETAVYYFTIAMSATGNYVYADLEFRERAN